MATKKISLTFNIDAEYDDAEWAVAEDIQRSKEHGIKDHRPLINDVIKAKIYRTVFITDGIRIVRVSEIQA